MKFAYLNGEDSTKRRHEVLQMFREGKLDILIASTILDEGFDAPHLRFLILAGGGKAEHRQVQRIGRGMRTATGKERLTVVDFMDKGKWLAKHSAARAKGYKGERAYTVMQLTAREVEDIL